MASISTIEQDSIKQKVERLVQKVGKSKAKKGPKVSSDELLGLFDICSCKCEEGCCSCPRDKKIPEKERAFVKDQRSVRKMFIGQEDKEETTRIQQKLERKRKSDVYTQKRKLDVDELFETVSSSKVA